MNELQQAPPKGYEETDGLIQCSSRAPYNRFDNELLSFRLTDFICPKRSIQQVHDLKMSIIIPNFWSWIEILLPPSGEIVAKLS